MLKIVIGATLVIACVPAIAQTAPAQLNQQQTATADAKVKSRVICRDEGEIGSRLATHRTCLTAEQWKEREEAARDAVADQQRRSTIPD